MLCSRFLKPPERASQLALPGFGRSARRHARRLRVESARRDPSPLRDLLVAIGTLVATGYLYTIAPKGFIPDQDTGQIQGTTALPQDASFDAMVTRRKAATVVAAESQRGRVLLRGERQRQ